MGGYIGRPYFTALSRDGKRVRRIDTCPFDCGIIQTRLFWLAQPGGSAG
jgi:hypothetical protein